MGEIVMISRVCAVFVKWITLCVCEWTAMFMTDCNL